MQNKLYLRTLVPLDNDYTMDLLCKPDLVEYIKKVKERLRIQSNGGEMSVNKKANIPGYNKKLWFRRIAIINIIKIKNTTEHYIVTYNINDHMFIVNKE